MYISTISIENDYKDSIFIGYLQSCYNGAIHIDRKFIQNSISQLTSAYNPAYVSK